VSRVTVGSGPRERARAGPPQSAGTTPAQPFLWHPCRVLDASTVTALLGALGVGSLVAAYVTANRDRRASRAAVLRKVQAIELERWAPVDWLKMREHSTELSAAALVAQLPRSVVSEYLALAHAAATLSQDNAERDPDDEYSGGISSEVAELAREGARVVIAVTWAPRPFARVRAWLGLRRLQRAEKAANDLESFGSRLKTARQLWTY